LPSAAPGTYPPAEALRPDKPNGVAAAAVLAAGVASFVLGLMIVLTEAIPAFKNAVNFQPPVGPLSGKTDIMVAAYVVSLIGLVIAWRDKSVNFGKVYTATLLLLALGLLGSFPLFYELFTAK
jgi:lysylphosphatidylglycerol synthetase-like protein (DUF2156 family)